MFNVFGNEEIHVQLTQSHHNSLVWEREKKRERCMPLLAQLVKFLILRVAKKKWVPMAKPISM